MEKTALIERARQYIPGIQIDVSTNGNGSDQDLISGRIALGNGKYIELGVAYPEGLIVGTLAPDGDVNLTDLLARFLPDAIGLPDVGKLSDLEFHSTPATGSFGLITKFDGSWTVPVGNSSVVVSDMWLALEHGPYGTRGEIHGKATLGPLDVDIGCRVAESTEITVDIPSVTIADIASMFLPSRDSWADDLPDITISHIHLEFDTARDFSFRATADPWEVQVGQLTLAIGEVGLEIEKSGSDWSGSLYGSTQIGESKFYVDWSLPGSFSLAAQLPPINLSSLIREVAGDVAPYFSDMLGNQMDITLPSSAIAVRKEGSSYALALIAQVENFGIVMLNLQSDPAGIALGWDLPDDWDLSNIPGFPTELGITFTQNLLVLSSVSDLQLPDPSIFPDSDLPEVAAIPSAFPEIEEGVTLYSAIGLKEGMLENVVKLLGLATEEDLQVCLHIGFDRTAKLSAAIPTEDGFIEFTNSGGMKILNPQLQLGIGVGNNYLGVEGRIELQVESQPITINGSLEIRPNGAEIAASYEGTLKWDQIFGIPASLALKDPTVELGISYQGLPTVGLKSDYTIADRINGHLAVKFNSIRPAQSMLSASFDKITLEDLVSIFTQDSVQVPAALQDILRRTSLSDVEIYIVPVNTSIGDDKYEQGFRFSGTLTILDMKATAVIDVDAESGIYCKVALEEPLSIGPLRIADASDNEGPELELSTKSGATYFKMSGLAQVGDILSGATIVTFSEGTLDFYVKTTIFSAFTTEIDARGLSVDDLSQADLEVTIVLDLDKVAEIIREVGLIQIEAQNAHAAIDEAGKARDRAQETLSGVYSGITSWLDGRIAANRGYIRENDQTISEMNRVGNTTYGYYLWRKWHKKPLVPARIKFLESRIGVFEKRIRNLEWL